MQTSECVLKVEIDRYGFFGADANTDSRNRYFQNFQILFSASFQRYYVFYAFFKKTLNMRIYELKISNCSTFNILL